MGLIDSLRSVGKAFLLYSVALALSTALYIYVLYLILSGYMRSLSRFLGLVITLSLYVAFSTVLLLGSLIAAYVHIHKLSQRILHLKPLSGALRLLVIAHLFSFIGSIGLLVSYFRDAPLDPISPRFLIMSYFLMIIGFYLVGSRMKSLELVGLEGLAGPPLIALGGLLTIILIGLIIARIGFLLAALDLLSLQEPPRTIVEEIKERLEKELSEKGMATIGPSIVEYEAAYELSLERGYYIYLNTLSRAPLVVL